MGAANQKGGREDNSTCKPYEAACNTFSKHVPKQHPLRAAESGLPPLMPMLSSSARGLLLPHMGHFKLPTAVLMTLVVSLLPRGASTLCMGCLQRTQNRNAVRRLVRLDLDYKYLARTAQKLTCPLGRSSRGRPLQTPTFLSRNLNVRQPSPGGKFDLKPSTNLPMVGKCNRMGMCAPPLVVDNGRRAASCR